MHHYIRFYRMYVILKNASYIICMDRYQKTPLEIFEPRTLGINATSYGYVSYWWGDDSSDDTFLQIKMKSPYRCVVWLKLTITRPNSAKNANIDYPFISWLNPPFLTEPSMKGKFPVENIRIQNKIQWCFSSETLPYLVFNPNLSYRELTFHWWFSQEWRIKSG